LKVRSGEVGAGGGFIDRSAGQCGDWPRFLQVFILSQNPAKGKGGPRLLQWAANRWPALSKVAGGVSVAGLLLLTLPRRRRGNWRLLTLLVLGLSGMAALTGCAGNHGFTFPGTPAGTSTVTVTATSGSVSQSATFSVVVTQ